MALPQIIADEVRRCEPCSLDKLTTLLSATLATGMGGPMSVEERHQWLTVVAADLSEIPADLAVEALTKARRSCRFASEVLPFIFEYVGDLGARRRRRLQSLIHLADVAGVAID